MMMMMISDNLKTTVTSVDDDADDGDDVHEIDKGDKDDELKITRRTEGQNQVIMRHLIIHFPMSSRVSKRVNE